MLVEILATIGLLIALYCVRHQRRKSRMPPGEWGWPVVGAMPGPKEPMGDVIKVLRKKYGDVFTWKIGSRVFLILCGFEKIKEVFYHPHAQHRADFESLVLFSKNKNIGLFNSYGEQWHMSRRFTMRHLRDLGLGKSSLETAVAMEAQHLVDDFRNHINKPTEMPLSISIAILNVIWKMVSDQRFELTDPEIIKFQQLVIDLFDETQGAVAFFDMFPALVPITPTFVYKWLGVQSFADKCKIFMDYMRVCIDEHKATLDPENPRDFIDAFLVEKANPANAGKEAFSDDNIEVTLGDLFTAGSESTASTLRWILLYVAKYPEVQDRLQQEIDREVPRDRLPGLEHRSKLGYTEAVFHEVQRLISFTPIAVPHLLSEDMNINGYNVPKGTIVVGHMEGCHMDPAYWERPNDFYPEHFLDSKGNFMHKKEGFVPFSIGRRVCPGEGLAKLNLFLMGSALLQTYRFTPAPGEKLSTERDPRQHLLTMPKPFKLIITERKTE